MGGWVGWVGMSYRELGVGWVGAWVGGMSIERGATRERLIPSLCLIHRQQHYRRRRRRRRRWRRRWRKLPTPTQLLRRLLRLQNTPFRIRLPVRPTHPLTYSSVRPSIHPPIHLLTYSFIHPSIHSSTYLPIHLSPSRPPIQLASSSLHSSIQSSTHPPTYSYTTAPAPCLPSPTPPSSLLLPPPPPLP